MAEEITIKSFNAIEDGATDYSNIRANFTSIGEVLNEHAKELKALARHQTFTVSKMFQTRGMHVLVNPGKHVRCKISHAYAVVHDNIDEEVHATLTGLSQEVKFNGSEKKGSAKIFYLLPNGIAHFNDEITVELSASRRVSVNVTFESIEERDS